MLLLSAEVYVTKIDSNSGAYENRTKSAKCGGLERNGLRERTLEPWQAQQCGGFCPRPAVIGGINALKTQRRMLGTKGLAEREGFEPPIRLPVCRISSAVHSTPLPPLHQGPSAGKSRGASEYLAKAAG